MAYGTWGATAAAVLEEFPVSVALADAAWGAALTGASAVVGGAVMEQVASAHR